PSVAGAEPDESRTDRIPARYRSHEPPESRPPSGQAARDRAFRTAIRADDPPAKPSPPIQTAGAILIDRSFVPAPTDCRPHPKAGHSGTVKAHSWRPPLPEPPAAANRPAASARQRVRAASDARQPHRRSSSPSIAGQWPPVPDPRRVSHAPDPAGSAPPEHQAWAQASPHAAAMPLTPHAMRNPRTAVLAEPAGYSRRYALSGRKDASRHGPDKPDRSPRPLSPDGQAQPRSQPGRFAATGSGQEPTPAGSGRRQRYRRSRAPCDRPLSRPHRNRQRWIPAFPFHAAIPPPEPPPPRPEPLACGTV